MACPKSDIFLHSEHTNLYHWIENFYISIVDANFISHLEKYKKVFDLLFILIDISKFSISFDKDKLLNKLLNIEHRWRGNELTTKDLEHELKRTIFELKEEKIEYKILILFSEIKFLMCDQKIDRPSLEFLSYKNDLIEKINSNLLTKFDKKVALNKLEHFYKTLCKNYH